MTKIDLAPDATLPMPLANTSKRESKAPLGRLRRPSQLLLALLVTAGAREAAAAITVSGTVTAYGTTAFPKKDDPTARNAPGLHVGSGRPVHITAMGVKPANEVINGHNCSVCARALVADVSAMTDANGVYSASVPTTFATCTTPATTASHFDPVTHSIETEEVCPGDHDTDFELTVTSPGDETLANGAHWTTTVPATANIPIKSAPQLLSPEGKYWARRIGDGAYPIVLIEGFDPDNSMKSNDLVQFVQKSPVAGYDPVRVGDYYGEGGLWAYARDNNFSIWILNTGDHGADSIKGINGDQNGLAYEAMRLVKDIRNTFHPTAKIVVGGYSMGGAVARAGVRKWCGGAWATSAVGPLDAGCDMISMWYAADAPLDGASIPAALQRYLHDSDISVPPELRARLDSPAARELMKESVIVNPLPATQTPCDTNCKDLGGCDSTETDFSEGCAFASTYRSALDAWQAGDIVRATTGRLVPAVALSVGTPPEGPGSVSNCNERLGFAGWAPFLTAHVDNAGNHNLYPNTGGGSGECAPGSRLDALGAIDGTSGSGFFDYKVTVDPQYPTFVPTTSSLLWSNRDVIWNDYWYWTGTGTPGEVVTNNDHAAPLPKGAAGFLMAWAKEYLQGKKDQVYCFDPINPDLYSADGVQGSAGKKPIPGSVCRTSVCGDGVCDSGVESQLNCAADCHPVLMHFPGDIVR